MLTEFYVQIECLHFVKALVDIKNWFGQVSMVTTDACGKLKTAFLFHLRRDSVACRSLVDELFPLPAQAQPQPQQPPDERDVDAALDRTVLRIATEMLDDIPAGDPRSVPRGPRLG